MNFGWSNAEIGRKMAEADGRLLFLDYTVCYNHALLPSGVANVHTTEECVLWRRLLFIAKLILHRL